MNTPGSGLGNGLIPVTRSELMRSGSELESEMIVVDLQDCSLGDGGALEFVKSLNIFITQEAEKHSAVLNLRKIRPSNANNNTGTHQKIEDQKGGAEENKQGETSTTTSTTHLVPTTNDLDLIDKRRPPVRMSINLSFNNITGNAIVLFSSLC